MKLLLSFLGTILSLLLFYFSPFLSEVQCCFDDFLHQFIVKAGLMFIAFQMIIATILHESSILSSDKVSSGSLTYELCLFEEKEEIEESSNGNVDDADDDDEEFSMQEMKQEVVEEELYGIKESDAYPKEDEEKINESEKNAVSGNNVNVEDHTHTSLDEDPSKHQISEMVEQEKMCGIGDAHDKCENDDVHVEDAEDNEDIEILERRIEEFIARSHQRWQEELLEEKLNILAIVNDSSYSLRNRMIEAAPQRKVMPRTSRPKNANNISKKQRLHTIGRLIESMQTKAMMIKMRSHPNSTRILFPVNFFHPTLSRVSCGH